MLKAGTFSSLKFGAKALRFLAKEGKQMKTLLQSLAKRSDCDYLEIRVEDTDHESILFTGRELDQVQKNKAYGGAIRALYKGGWGFVSFNSLEGLEAKVEMAIAQAKAIGNTIGEKSMLAPAKVIVDVVPLDVKMDIRKVALSDKVELLRGYNELMLGVSENIKSTRVFYKDAYIRKYFANSEGTYIEQEKIDLGANFSAMAAKNGKTQSYYVGVGSSNDYGVMLGLEQKAKEAAETANALLDAPQVESGTYTVILDPILSGTFIHEAFGHLSEGDNVYENPALAQVMKMGREFGKPILNVYDTGLDAGTRGYLKYDDEGVPTEKTYLIKEGKLVGRLHSRETAGKMGERATGSGRAINFKFPPIPRMRNTCIEIGQASQEDMLKSIKNGLLCKGVFGGQTNGEMFTFSSMATYKIEDGKIGKMCQGSVLQGNVFETLNNIDVVGSDFAQPDSAGGCGKGGQMPLPTSHGAPSVRIQNVVVSGK